MPDAKLESPESAESLYEARGQDVAEMAHRPLFTGDVLRVEGRTVALLQHPCAMRRGTDLVPWLLAAQVQERNGPPPNWTGSYRRMFLPEAFGTRQHTVEFDEIELLTAGEAAAASRLVILSLVGVNLLLQRYVHHNTRVVVPTERINEMTVGKYEEADLIAEAVSDMVAAGHVASSAEHLVDSWLSESGRRDDLDDSQRRSGLRRSLRGQVREWVAGE